MRLWTAMTCSMLLAGCGTATPSAEDVTGTWKATLDFRTCAGENNAYKGCINKLNWGTEVTLTLSQVRGKVTGALSHVPVVLGGRLDGQILQLDGSGTAPYGVTFTQSWRVQVSGDRLTGTFSELQTGSNGSTNQDAQWTEHSTAMVQAVRQR
jgi:hypothetical protein